MESALEEERKKLDQKLEQEKYLQQYRAERQEYEQFYRRVFFENVFKGKLTFEEMYSQQGASDWSWTALATICCSSVSVTAWTVQGRCSASIF